MSILVRGPNGRRVGVLHMPKTAGTWLRKVLAQVEGLEVQMSPVNGTHSRHCGLASWKGEGPDHSLTCVRHPVSWLESWWRYNWVPGWPAWEADRIHPCRWTNRLINRHPEAGVNFPRFVELVCEEFFQDFSRMYREAVEGVDTVFQYEAQGAYITRICAEAGLAVIGEAEAEAVAPMNVSPKMVVEWRCGQAARLQDQCAEAFEIHAKAEI